ncbi:MAG TPA: BatA and WFA domain-containing protein [Bacillota bacterium]|nr:BatA and WFA domain-containing protein [Bacillota bacterium]HQO42899.1 BatA and WFA domain-containing protein [Bacillota bacterium]HQQ45456.1 BatA and WFA domain-containing protein [Bacillota bacterium]
MTLFSPWALWFLSFMPLVVLMYILKQKFEERQISSIYLWQQVLKDIEVNTPWQKLKKNLLLFLQLLSILFLVFALSDPYLYTGGGMHSNLVIVIDNTGSMNARYENGTRLAKAKQLAEEMISRSGTKANITLLTVGRSPRVEIGKTTDKGEAISKLRGINPGNSSGNINDSVSLVRAMIKQYEGSDSYKAVFYTDSPVNTEDLNAEVVPLASELVNVSLDYISYSDDNGKLTVLVRASNRSNTSLKREISLYGNDKVMDIKNVEIPAGETMSVYFEGISANAPYIWAELTEKDDLVEDNQVYGVLNFSKPKKVLLISTGNAFIERALSNIEGLELYKTNPDADIDEGYDLYIFDSTMPSILTESGSVLTVNPTGAELQGGIADIATHTITKYMENANFTVSKLKDMEVPFWADILIKFGDNAAAISGEYKGRKMAVIGFDLHDSDFPLTTEYPIFMYNLAAYLVGIDTEGKTSYVCGDAIDLSPNPEVTEAVVKDPEGIEYRLELAYPMLPFDNTGQYGVYELTQKIDETEKVSSFAVNFPTESESVNSKQEVDISQEASEAGNTSGGTRLQELFLGLMLMAAAIEWVVYIRGY